MVLNLFEGVFGISDMYSDNQKFYYSAHILA